LLGFAALEADFARERVGALCAVFDALNAASLGAAPFTAGNRPDLRIGAAVLVWLEILLNSPHDSMSSENSPPAGSMAIAPSCPIVLPATFSILANSASANSRSPAATAFRETSLSRAARRISSAPTPHWRRPDNIAVE
jgi:hypothetical protein